MNRWMAMVWLVLLTAGCQTTRVADSAPAARPAVARSLESAMPAAAPPPGQGLAYRSANRREDGTLLAAADAPAGLWIRVADVGQGLCVVGVTEDGYSFLIDAGHWTGRRCAAAVDTLLPNGAGISLVVLTHNDSDHLGNLKEILERDVDTILWTGRVPPDCKAGSRHCPATYRKAVEAIGKAAQRGTTVINLKTTPMQPGETFVLGDVEVMFLAGWHDFPDTTGLGEAERENVVSIMTRISYGGHAILVTGDAIGRPLNAPDSACIGSEAWAVHHLDPEWLSADVLVASHHGADNGSAACFITAVAPEHVIFSAGGGYGHPRQSTAERLGRLGIDAEGMLRSDRGSDSEADEWEDGMVPRCGDSAGDDDIDIVATAGQRLDIGYTNADRCSIP